MKRVILSALFLAFVSIAVSMPEGAAGRARRGSQIDRDADAVVLYDSLAISMDNLGYITTRRHRAVVLYTDNAIGRYGDPRILFDSRREELRVKTARVHRKDGATVDTKANGINRTTPFGLDLAPDYAGWQETVVTHVGIEKGCTAELEYEIVDLEPRKNLSGLQVFSAEDPTRLRVVVVRLPQGQELTCCRANGAPEPERKGSCWTWTVRDLPGRTPYDGGSWEGEYFPSIAYSTASSLEESLFDAASKISEAGVPFASCKSAIDKVLEGVNSEEEKILSVQKLSLESVRSVRVPYGLLSSPPRTAQRIYDSGYASTLDRAVLLAAMLRTAGFEAEPVLVSLGRSFCRGAEPPEFFGSVVISVSSKEGGELFLDPLSPYSRDGFSMLSGKTLVRLGKELSIFEVPRVDPSANRSSMTIEISPCKDGRLAGHGRALLMGVFSPYYMVRSGLSLEKYAKEHIENLLGGAELKKFSVLSLERHRCEMEFEFEAALSDLAQDERAYLPFPLPFDAELSGIERVKLERSYIGDAIKLVPCNLEVSCTLEIPPGWKLVSLPQESSVKSGIGSAAVTVEARSDGKKIVRSELSIEQDIAEPSFYADLKALVSSFEGGLVVLERE